MSNIPEKFNKEAHDAGIAYAKKFGRSPSGYYAINFTAGYISGHSSRDGEVKELQHEVVQGNIKLLNQEQEIEELKKENEALKAHNTNMWIAVHQFCKAINLHLSGQSQNSIGGGE